MKFIKDLNLSDWTKLSIKVIVLFASAMFLTYIPEHLRYFFDDYAYQDGWRSGLIDEGFDWGWRHCLYFWMCIVLFTIQAVRIGKWIFEQDFKI